MATDTFTYRWAGRTITASVEVAANTGDVPIPTNIPTVKFSSLGLPATGEGFRAAWIDARCAGKVIDMMDMPNTRIAFNNYAQGNGAKWVAGLMGHPTLNRTNAAGIRAHAGIEFTMASSQFADFAAANSSDGMNYVSTFHFYQIPILELSGFTITGANFNHFYNGILMNGQNKPYVHDIKYRGAARGGWNMPPAETYSQAFNGVTNPIVHDLDFDGRAAFNQNKLWSSTFLGWSGGTMTEGVGEFARIVGRNSLSGFLGVSYKSNGTITRDCKSEDLGIFAGGTNGCFWNHELSFGKIRHYRPVIDLDGYWGNIDRPAKTTARPNGRRRSLIADIRAYAGDPTKTGPGSDIYTRTWANPDASFTTADNVMKFGHMTFWNTTTPDAYKDAQIIDPVFDSYGEKVGGFAITVDDPNIYPTINVYPKVVIGGVERTPLLRPNWGNWNGQSTPFDPSKHYIVARGTWG